MDGYNRYAGTTQWYVGSWLIRMPIQLQYLVKIQRIDQQTGEHTVLVVCINGIQPENIKTRILPYGLPGRRIIVSYNPQITHF